MRILKKKIIKRKVVTKNHYLMPKNGKKITLTILYSKSVCVTVLERFLFPLASTSCTSNFKLDIILLSYLEGLAI